MVVRGKGTARFESATPEPGDEDPPHVLIKGPDQASIDKARQLCAMLVDFNSEEGEAWRSDAQRQLRVLNGTLNVQPRPPPPFHPPPPSPRTPPKPPRTLTPFHSPTAHPNPDPPHPSLTPD